MSDSVAALKEQEECLARVREAIRELNVALTEAARLGIAINGGTYYASKVKPTDLKSPLQVKLEAVILIRKDIDL